MKPLLELELLNTFVTVVREGGFKGAATRLFRSQAAVSMQIKRLEEQLGTQLLLRNNQGIRLTAEGEILLAYTERLLRLNNETLNALRQAPVQGSVHFGIPTDYTRTFLNRFLPRLQETFPELRPRITCACSRILREKVQRGELDIAVVTGEPRFQGERTLWRERVTWYAPVAMHPEEQRPLPVALFETDCILRDLLLQDLKQARTDYRPVITSPALDNVAAAVDAGLAVALLPESTGINPSRIRPLNIQALAGNHLLNINLIHSDTFNRDFLHPLTECITDTMGVAPH